MSGTTINPELSRRHVVLAYILMKLSNYFKRTDIVEWGERELNLCEAEESFDQITRIIPSVVGFAYAD